MKVAALLGLALLTLPALATAQDEKRPPTPPPTPGEASNSSPTPHARERAGEGELAIGDTAPDFELDSSTGKPLKLSTTRGGWVLLVFGPRKESLASLRDIVDEARTMNVSMIGVCDEKAYHLVSYVRKEHFPFVLLADVTDEVAQMYGLYDSDRRTTAPGFVVIDPKGEVRMALLGQAVPPADMIRLTRFAVTGQ